MRRFHLLHLGLVLMLTTANSSWAQVVEQGVVSGQITASQACHGTPPTCELFAADRNINANGYGFYTQVAISQQSVLRAISGVCQETCDAPGKTGDIATWIVQAQDGASQVSATKNVQVTMVFNMDVPAPAAAGAGASIVQFLRNKDAADQYSDSVRHRTEQRLQQERNSVQQLRSSVGAFESQKMLEHLDRLSTVATAWGDVPASVRSQSAVNGFMAYRSLAASPFAVRHLQYDDVTARYAIRELQSRLAAEDYSGAVDVLNSVYDSNHRGDLDILPPNAISDGVVRLDRINKSLPVSPFAGTRFSTPSTATGGQELRQVANSFEAFWGESNGLANYSDLATNEYVIGLVFLRQADQTFESGTNSLEGFGYLQASKTMLEIAQGISAGVGDSIKSIVRAVPLLGKGVLKFSQLLYSDPGEQYRILYDVVTSVPGVGRALAKQFKGDIDAVLSGSPFERSRAISRITTDVLVAYFTGTTLEGAALNPVSIVDVSAAESAATELGRIATRADEFSVGAAARAESVAPIVQEVTVTHLIQTSTFSDASSSLVEYSRPGGVSAATRDYEGFQGTEEMSADGRVRYKDELAKDRFWRVVLRTNEGTRSSKADLPTLEIQSTIDGKAQPIFKFRYPPDKQ